MLRITYFAYYSYNTMICDDYMTHCLHNFQLVSTHMFTGNLRKTKGMQKLWKVQASAC